MPLFGQVVNRISQSIVDEKQFDSMMDQSSATMIGLCTDAIGGAVYAYNEDTLYEVSFKVLVHLFDTLFLF